MSRVMGRLRAVDFGRLSKKPGMHCDGGGLYLAVQPMPSTGCSWIFRYMIDKKAKTMGLGPYPEITLAEAREKAADYRRMKAHGQDPLTMRRAAGAMEKAVMPRIVTFSECAKAYIKDHEAGWKNGGKTAAQWSASLSTYAYPTLGALPVQAVNTALIMKVLKADTASSGEEPSLFWMAKPETASRVRGRIEVILDWAETNGHREPGKNPARWKGHLDNNLPARGRVRPVVGHAALPIAETPPFMVELAKRPALAARALEMTVLTATRTNEALGAKWAEIDIDKALWTIPAARMKAGRDHRVPLSSRVASILHEVRPLADERGYVFPGRGGRSLSNMSMLALLRRMGRGDLTAHGFRSTFRDWAAETGVPRDLAEACLAHTISNKAEAAYLRSDVLERRRTVMSDWALFCGS